MIHSKYSQIVITHQGMICKRIIYRNVNSTNLFFVLLSCIYIFNVSCSDPESKSNSLRQEHNRSSHQIKQQDDERTEWSQWLDRYENLVEKNNELRSRIKSGDLTAAQEAISVSQELVEVARKCQENQENMTTTDVQRMMIIMQKVKY